MFIIFMEIDYPGCGQIVYFKDSAGYYRVHVIEVVSENRPLYFGLEVTDVIRKISVYV